MGVCEEAFKPQQNKSHMKKVQKLKRTISFISSAIHLVIVYAMLSLITPAKAASPAGDVVGKISVGYQGWFACNGDGSPMNNWWHWSANWSQPPSPSNNQIPAWPDVREYATTYQTAYANLNNGQPAKLFSSYDQQTVNTHFRWMQQNNIDTAALQRFNPNAGEANRDGMATRVRTAAETYGVKFYIMYDVTGWTAMQTEIKTDWTTKMSALTASSAYAKQNGMPVVCIWGLGLNDANHPWTPAVCLDVVNWFKSQGCYVIGGVRREWRTVDTTYLTAYNAMNMISPWLIGSVGNTNDADNVYNTYMVGDQSYCNSHNIDYQPCVLPGDLSIGQRSHGDLMWHMFYNAKRVGCQGIYISMFDEYGEANQIAKTAETSSFLPSNSGLRALNEDGTPCSSDYYLRLTGDGGRMLKGQIALTPVRPTPTQTVTFYQDPNYGSAASQGLIAGNYTLSQLAAQGVPNDWASSVYIPSGWTVTMYADDNFGGTSWTLTSPVADFTALSPNANDQMSSCKITSSGNSNTPQNGSTYHLICQSSGKALDNRGSITNGSAVAQWADSANNSNQEWKLIDEGNDYYHLICQTGSLALDNRGSTTDGTDVGQWADQGAGNHNQNWSFVNVGGGYYHLICQTSGKALDNRGSTTDGTNVGQWADQGVGNPNQNWRLEFIR